MASQVEERAEVTDNKQRYVQATVRNPGFPRAVGIYWRVFTMRATCPDVHFIKSTLAAVCNTDFCRVVKVKTWSNAIASTL